MVVIKLLKKKILKYRLEKVLLKQQPISISVQTKGCNVLVTYSMNNVTFSCSYINLYVFKRPEYYDYFKYFLIANNIKQSDYEKIRDALLEYLLLFNSTETKRYILNSHENSVFLKQSDNYIKPIKEEYININNK